MLIKQPLAPQRAQCNASSMLRNAQLWGFSKSVYIRLSCRLHVCVACLLTFAVQQSILQMHMRKLRACMKVVCFEATIKCLIHKGHKASSFTLSSLALGWCTKLQMVPKSMTNNTQGFIFQLTQIIFQAFDQNLTAHLTLLHLKQCMCKHFYPPS